MRTGGVMLLVGASLLAGGCGGGDTASGARARHLVLVTVDTWRGDHVLAERAGVPLTPRLAELARSGVVFTEALSVSNCTSPGTAGILTGLWPHRSGVDANIHRLSDGLPTLAGTLHAAGFRTAAFVSNPVLRSGTGFEQGFDVYERIRSPDLPKGGRRAKPRADMVTDAALAWLDDAYAGSDERLFLWIHYMEPHGPYEPPPALSELFPRDAFDAPGQAPLLSDNSGRGGIPIYQQAGVPEEHKADARDYLSRYAGEVRAFDDALAHLVAALDERGLYQGSALVLTSDHGEALADDHGFWFSHENGATPDQLHVPLLLVFPGCAAGSVVTGPVSTVDIAPTVLDLLGVAASPELDGRSLLDGGSPTILSQTARQTAVRQGSWDLLARPGGKLELYDLKADPTASTDVSADHPNVVRRLSEAAARLDERPPLTEPDVRERFGGG